MYILGHTARSKLRQSGGHHGYIRRLFSKVSQKANDIIHSVTQAVTSSFIKAFSTVVISIRLLLLKGKKVVLHLLGKVTPKECYHHKQLNNTTLEATVEEPLQKTPQSLPSRNPTSNCTDSRVHQFQTTSHTPISNSPKPPSPLQMVSQWLTKQFRHLTSMATTTTSEQSPSLLSSSSLSSLSTPTVSNLRKQ